MNQNDVVTLDDAIAQLVKIEMQLRKEEEE